MDRRLTFVSSILIWLFSSIGFAQDPTAEVEVHRTDPLGSLSQPIDLSIMKLRYTSTNDFVDSVTMKSLPQGSLLIRFDGLQSVFAREARSQFRRFERQAAQAGWSVPDEPFASRRDVYPRLDQAAIDLRSNGVWWNRSWWEALPAEKGGAPRTPYVHTYGSEISWHCGPLSFTNTLKCKFDCFDFFEFDPDPTSANSTNWVSPFDLDIHPLADLSTVTGTTVKFDVRPTVHLGLPQDDWLGMIRGVSIQFTVDIRDGRRRLIKGEVELRWRPEEGVAALFEIAIVAW